jgi:hypothetical protein
VLTANLVEKLRKKEIEEKTFNARMNALRENSGYTQLHLMKALETHHSDIVRDSDNNPYDCYKRLKERFMVDSRDAATRERLFLDRRQLFMTMAMESDGDLLTNLTKFVSDIELEVQQLHSMKPDTITESEKVNKLLYYTVEDLHERVRNKLHGTPNITFTQLYEGLKADILLEANQKRAAQARKNVSQSTVSSVPPIANKKSPTSETNGPPTNVTVAPHNSTEVTANAAMEESKKRSNHRGIRSFRGNNASSGRSNSGAGRGAGNRSLYHRSYHQSYHPYQQNHYNREKKYYHVNSPGYDRSRGNNWKRNGKQDAKDSKESKSDKERNILKETKVKSVILIVKWMKNL